MQESMVSARTKLASGDGLILDTEESISHAPVIGQVLFAYFSSPDRSPSIFLAAKRSVVWKVCRPSPAARSTSFAESTCPATAIAP